MPVGALETVIASEFIPTKGQTFVAVCVVVFFKYLSSAFKISHCHFVIYFAEGGRNFLDSKL